MIQRGDGATIVLLGTDGASTRIIYHALANRFGPPVVIVERSVPARSFFRRRARRLGVRRTAGQILFMGIVQPLLRRQGRRRIATIIGDHGLDASPIPGPVTRVNSVNDTTTMEALRRASPAAVVVSGTRIIASKILSCVDAPFINMHAGVTPSYRGVHGGYWALAEGKPELVGTTIHLLDAGIDTGTVIEQVRFDITHEDTLATYPFLHIAAGLPALLDSVARVLEDRLELRQEVPDIQSALRYHPTLLEYVSRRLARGVR